MKKRNPLIAFLFSFFISGLGQVYNGELSKGIFYLCIIFPIYLLLGLAGMISSFTGFMTIVGIIVLYKFLIGLEAYVKARSLREYKLKSINQIWKYVLFAVFSLMITLVGTQINRSLIGYDAFIIPTNSMEPSLVRNEKIIATRIKPQDLKIGDIIIFKRKYGQSNLKRVLALPNNEVQIINDKISINGELEIWTETKKSNSEKTEYQEYKALLPNGKTYLTKKTISVFGRPTQTQDISNSEIFKIPNDEIFVLGDNRNNSLDSRTFGTIPFIDIYKKVNYIWWSKDKDRIGLKLDN